MIFGTKQVGISVENTENRDCSNGDENEVKWAENCKEIVETKATDGKTGREAKEQRHYYGWEQKNLDKRSFATWVDKLQSIDTAEWPTCPQPPHSQIFFDASFLTVQFFKHISAGFFTFLKISSTFPTINAGFNQTSRLDRRKP